MVVMGAFAWASPRIAEPAASALAFAPPAIGTLALILSNRSLTRSPRATLRTPNWTSRVVVGLALPLLLAARHVPWAAGAPRFAHAQRGPPSRWRHAIGWTAGPAAA